MCAVSFSTFNSAGEESITGTQVPFSPGYPYYEYTGYPWRWQKRNLGRTGSEEACERCSAREASEEALLRSVSGTSQHYTGVRDLLREAPAENMDEVFARNVMKQGKNLPYRLNAHPVHPVPVTVLRNL